MPSAGKRLLVALWLAVLLFTVGMIAAGWPRYWIYVAAETTPQGWLESVLLVLAAAVAALNAFAASLERGNGSAFGGRSREAGNSALDSNEARKTAQDSHHEAGGDGAGCAIERTEKARRISSRRAIRDRRRPFVRMDREAWRLGLDDHGRGLRLAGARRAVRAARAAAGPLLEADGHPAVALDGSGRLAHPVVRGLRAGGGMGVVAPAWQGQGRARFFAAGLVLAFCAVSMDTIDIRSLGKSSERLLQTIEECLETAAMTAFASAFLSVLTGRLSAWYNKASIRRDIRDGDAR
ncbi:hypothetical protein OMP38_19155 [Cohnella ginsengisoli]|uniref:Uncharacterized protein n=1 Tax=Cohnella ginsengisoli TaxID=425004 RepID=A0A9X4QNG3_9BACL|nr:hypothetical protein [Cohnella ginsengisoli]MDG0792753.1 hypothetical protein [Cohnella ginsengisoli]